MPQVSSRCRCSGAATVSALLGTLVAVVVLLLCTDTGAGGLRATEAPVATGVIAAPEALPSTAEREPGCRERHRDGVGSAPVAPPRGATAYELLPALYDAARAGAGSWGADGLGAQAAIDRRPPPLDPPTPISLSVLRV